MTKVTGVAIAVLMLAACKGKSADKKADPAPATGTAAPAAGDAGAAAPATDGAVAAGADPRCETQCRFLANTPRKDVATFYQDACGTAWVAPPADDCDALDFQRNCIYATAGYTFKKPKWQEAFGKLPWYKARPDFKETDLSRIATANIRELKQDALTCRGVTVGEESIPAKFTASKLTRADQKTIVGWFARKAKGELVLPAKLEADFQPATPEEIKQWMASPGLFTLEEWTPMEYRDGDGKAGEPRSVYVGTSATGPGCIDHGGEECEGFEVIYFDLDAKGAIVGISVTAAACPLVYLEGAGGALSYQGEILRHLGRPSFERTESLGLDALPTCGGEVRVQLVEAKDELTYLDDVALMIDGLAIAPRACGEAGAAPAYCDDDGRHLTLARGQSLALVFDVPAGARCTAPALRANGHYVPAP